MPSEIPSHAQANALALLEAEDRARGIMPRVWHFLRDSGWSEKSMFRTRITEAGRAALNRYREKYGQ